MTFALSSGLTAVFTGLVLAVLGTVLGKHHHYNWYIVAAVGIPLAGVGALVAAIALAAHAIG